MESTLSSPCSCSDFLLSLTTMQLSLTLTLSHHTMWCLEQTALFLFFLAKATLAYLPTAVAVALRPHLFSMPIMFKFFHRSLHHSASSLLVSAAPTSVPLVFSYLTLALSSPPCPLLHLFFYLNLSGRNCLLSVPVLSGYNGSPDNRFS